MRKNVVLSQPQVTVDYTFRVPSDIETICRAFAKKNFFCQRHREVLQSIGQFGLKQDHNLRLDSTELGDLGGALEYLRDNYPDTELAQVGGNSAIAALRGHYLGVRDRDPSIPIVKYGGLHPASLEEFKAKQKTLAPAFHNVLEEVFDRALCVEIPEKPMTVALEGQCKIIIAYGKGRTINYLQDGDFSGYLKRLTPLISRNDDGKVLFAFPSVLHPIELGAELLDQIQKMLGENTRFFFGCSTFRDGATLNFDRTQQVWDSMLKRAHILSMNETELGDLHTVVVGKGTYQDKPLAYKLLELPTDAIKVCHGADGSLMDPGPDPGRIINADAFANKPADFLEESLRFATDGATYGIASPLGHDATEASVRIFSKTVPNRNSERFKAAFLNVLESMPPGLIAVHTPVVARSMSALTGVGARFDGLLATFLMRS